MKRLLLPLLAALSLPTAANAEILRLKCGETEFSINENAGNVVVATDKKIIKTTNFLASSDSFILKYSDFFTYKYEIDRATGEYAYKLWLEDDPEILASMQRIEALAGKKVFTSPLSESDKEKKATQLYGSEPCKKVKKKKTLF